VINNKFKCLRIGKNTNLFVCPFLSPISVHMPDLSLFCLSTCRPSNSLMNILKASYDVVVNEVGVNEEASNKDAA
jgi:hypothetical protein